MKLNTENEDEKKAKVESYKNVKQKKYYWEFFHFFFVA